jgi:hypothetical protein
MGFSWRGRSEARPVEPVDSAEATGYEVDGAEADVHMKRLKDQHRFDPFMEISKLDAIDNVIQSGDVEKEAVVEEQLIGENSPYAEVRASVSLFIFPLSCCLANRQTANDEDENENFSMLTLRHRFPRTMTPISPSTPSVPGRLASSLAPLWRR